MPRAYWRDVRRFCENEHFSWRRTDHDYFDKVFPGGETAGTKISNGADGKELNDFAFNKVWKHQLRCASIEDFWHGVNGEPVTYAIPVPPEPPLALPAYLRKFLSETEHLSDSEIVRISLDEATARWIAYLSRPRDT